jgi:biopolymer transport protein ExbB
MTPSLEPKPLVVEALEIWHSGGWGMWPLAACGLILYGLGANMMLQLLAKGIYSHPETVWKQWREGKRRKKGGAATRILEGSRDCGSLHEIEVYFDTLRNEELRPFMRNLRIIKVTVSIAPLLGLLGTVTGMFSTFQALAQGSGGDKTMDKVASGISEALITTETGLVMALTGLVFQFMLARMHNQFSRLVVHLESLVMQAFQSQTRQEAA